MHKLFQPDLKKKDSQSAKTGMSSYFKTPPFVNIVYLSLLINVVSLIGAFFLKKYLPPVVPLFYGLAEGEDQLTKSLGLTIAPGISLFIVVFNSILSSFLDSDLLRKTLIVTGFCVSIFSFVTLLKIVLLVGYF